MELQSQIYLLIAVFGGLAMLLFVLIVVLSVYVRKTRKLFASTKPGYDHDPYNGEDYGAGERDRHRGVGAPAHHGYPVEMHSRMDYKSDLTKARNDYMQDIRNMNHHRGYRADDDAGYGGKRGGRAKSHPHDASPDGRVPDAAFETEVVSNIFDMDDLDEELADHDSVEDGRSTRYLSNRVGQIDPKRDPKSPASNHYGRGGMTGNGGASSINRFNSPHSGNKR